MIVTLLISQQWWLAFPLGYWVLRIYTAHHATCWWKMIVVMVICAAWACHCLHSWQRKTLNNEQAVQQSLLVMPDQIQVNGNLVSLVAADNQGQRESVSWCCRTAEEQQWWLGVHQPVRVQASGKLQPVMLPTNVAQFNLRNYYRERGICNQLRADRMDKQLVTVARPFAQFHCWRACLHQYFVTLPQPLGQYCDCLLIGFNGPREDWQKAVRQLGILHLFCISGMHVVLAVELLRRLLIRLRLTREGIDGLLILFLPAYLVLAGGAVSLVRAVIMAECHLLGRRLHLTGTDAWSISLILGLVHDPLMLMGMGGQLSYLLSLMMYFVEEHGWRQSFQLNLLGLPSILHGAFEFHVLSLVTSYLVMPFFGAFIFPGTIVTALTYPFVPLIANAFNELLLLFHHCLIWMAHLPGEICFGRPSGPATMLLLCLTLLVVDRPGSHRRWGILLLTYFLVFSVIHLPLRGEVTFVDIGQGDSIIIRTPLNRQVIMIDTGGRLNFSQGQWARVKTSRSNAERCSINYLKSQGINHLDALCLTHSDADHIGDTPAVLKNMRVRRVVVPAGMEKLPKFTRKLSINVPVQAAKSDDIIDNVLTVVHPERPGQGKNEDSLTSWGFFGGQAFLFTGDLDRAGERAVIQRYPNLKVDVLKLGHHGSRTASDPEAIKHWKPGLGIVSAGRFNRYGHPNRETMTTLQMNGVRSMSTQQYGMITYRYRGSHGTWKTCLRGDELKWMLPPYSNS